MSEREATHEEVLRRCLELEKELAAARDLNARWESFAMRRAMAAEARIARAEEAIAIELRDGTAAVYTEAVVVTIQNALK